MRMAVFHQHGGPEVVRLAEVPNPASGRGGRIVTCCAIRGATAETDFRTAVRKQLSILGTTMASEREFETVLGLLARDRPRPVVGATRRLEKARVAQARLEQGGVVGKIVQEVG